MKLPTITNPMHPLAEHPLRGLPAVPACTLQRHDRTYLSALMLEASLAQCGPYVKGQLLDVGCGHRPYQKTYFAGAAKYVGMDYLTDRSQPDVVGSATAIPLADASFDTVVSTEVLEHVTEPLVALKEMRRVLKPGGYLILTTPMYWPRHEAPYDFFRYPYDGLLHLFKESGWEVVRMFNRGHSYALLGQVVMHLSPHILQPRPVARLLNSFFLWCDTHRRHDMLTMGWTVVARPVVKPA